MGLCILMGLVQSCDGHPAIGMGWNTPGGYGLSIGIGIIETQDGYYPYPVISGCSITAGTSMNNRIYLEYSQGEGMGKAIVF